MSQFVDDEVEGAVEEFDLNDPTFLSQLNEIVPDINMDEIPKLSRPAPPPDGLHWAKIRLRGDKAEPVYYKNVRKDPESGKFTADSVVAILTVRVIDPDTGQEGAFLKDWYASTATPKVAPGAPPKGSSLTAICKLAGQPIKQRASFPEIKAHVERVFAEAGDEGILVLVKSQWIKSIPKTVEINGIKTYVYKAGSQYKDYEPDIRGEKRIKDEAAKRGIPEDQAHIWYDPVTGDERTVSAQVQSLEDPSKYEQV